MMELLERLFDLHKEDVSAITGKKEIDKVIADFALNAFYAKNDAFEEEREYRVIGARVSQKYILEDSRRQEKKIFFRSRGGLIVPYIEFFKESTLPIKSIIVGPHPFQEKQMDSIRLLLDSTPFSRADVRLSNIPLNTMFR
jgi:hypothetical protein